MRHTHRNTHKHVDIQQIKLIKAEEHKRHAHVDLQIRDPGQPLAADNGNKTPTILYHSTPPPAPPPRCIIGAGDEQQTTMPGAIWQAQSMRVHYCPVHRGGDPAKRPACWNKHPPLHIVQETSSSTISHYSTAQHSIGHGHDIVPASARLFTKTRPVRRKVHTYTHHEQNFGGLGTLPTGYQVGFLAHTHTHTK